MNGVHDLGGVHGFGRVQREENEPVFHAEWEKVVLSINRIAGAQGIWSIDESRYGIERMAPARYLAASYYERWLDAQVRNLMEHGVISQDELEARIAELERQPDTPLPEPPDPTLTERLAGAVRRGRRYQRPGPDPRFEVGEPVVTRNMHPKGHTRLPRYARGKRGVIQAYHGVYVFPDTNASGEGEQPQPLYAVQFEAAELWGEAAEPRSLVFLDLWESYMEKV